MRVGFSEPILFSYKAYENKTKSRWLWFVRIVGSHYSAIFYWSAQSNDGFSSRHTADRNEVQRFNSDNAG